MACGEGYKIFSHTCVMGALEKAPQRDQANP